MALTRLNPLTDVTPLWDAMDRFIADAFGSSDGWMTLSANGVRSMPLEVFETPDQFIVRAMVPGVRTDDLAVEYDAGVLTIRARTQAPELKDGWRTHLAEIPYGDVVRQVRLPRPIEVDQVQSTFEHGILTVTMPKVAEARPRRIEIRTPAQLGSGTDKA